MFAAEILSLTATFTPLSLSVSPNARLRLLIVIDTSGSPSTSVYRKSETANVFAVSSSVVTLLARATGASSTGVTWIVIVADTVPLSASFTVKSNVLRAKPLAFAAGE